MLLATRTPRSQPPLQLHRAALAPFAEDAAEALRAATVVADGTAADGGPGCVHDLTYLRKGVVALLVNATNRSDPLWPQVHDAALVSSRRAEHERRTAPTRLGDDRYPYD